MPLEAGLRVSFPKNDSLQYTLRGRSHANFVQISPAIVTLRGPGIVLLSLPALQGKRLAKPEPHLEAQTIFNLRYPMKRQMALPLIVISRDSIRDWATPACFRHVGYVPPRPISLILEDVPVCRPVPPCPVSLRTCKQLKIPVLRLWSSTHGTINMRPTGKAPDPNVSANSFESLKADGSGSSPMWMARFRLFLSSHLQVHFLGDLQLKQIYNSGDWAESPSATDFQLGHSWKIG